MTEEETRKKIEENERMTVQCVCDTLQAYGGRIRLYLADFISALCDVDKERMFSACNELDVAQARGLYFYAYRYMTGYTYEKIGKTAKDLYNKEFTGHGVASSVNKMYMLIEQQPIWRKRWMIVKRIIKTQNEIDFEPPIPITITVPSNVEVTIKKE